jgi:hypothetical protein
VRIESLAIALRPRLAAEAGDLGVALVQTHAASVWRSFAPVFGAFLLLAGATVEIAPWLPVLMVFWFKPWLDRSLLFILARAVFGQSTRFADVWRERAAIWRGQWLRTLLRQRLSPWRAFTQPVFQLEGQRRQAARQRCRLLLSGQRGMAALMQFAFANIEGALYLGLISAALWLAPAGQRNGVFQWFITEHADYWVLLPVGLYAAVVLVVEPFYVAAGLAMYLNRRVELEAWDIEQEFRHVV